MKNRSLLLYCLLSMPHASRGMELEIAPIINNEELSTATQLCIKGFDTKDRSLVKNGIQMGANVNYTHPGPNGLNFMQRACLADNWRMVAYLLDAPAIKINAYREGTVPAFHYAVGRENKYIIALLLAHDPETVNVQNSLGNTSLHIMTQINNKKMVKFLLSMKNINPNIRNNIKETPFNKACTHGSTESIRYFIAHDNIDRFTPNNIGEIPFDKACSSGKIKIVKKLFLMDKTAINSTDYYGYTPLHTACLEGDYNIIKFLLHKGGCPTTKTNSQRTPLAVAYFENSNFDMLYTPRLKRLVNKKDKQGNTQLHLAVWIYDDLKVFDDYLSFLVAKGLRIGERNNDNKRPVDIACDIYTKLYNQYMAKKILYLEDALIQQEAIMHAFLRLTSPYLQCALFTTMIEPLPEDLHPEIARMYYALNIETIIAKKYKHDEKYYNDFIENKEEIKRQLLIKPEPKLLWR